MALPLAAALSALGCRKAIEDFPEGLEPLEENLAPSPAGRSDDPYPESLSLVSGTEDTYDWAHGRGYVHASLTDTWDALRDPAVDVDRRRVQEYTVSELDLGEYDDHYLIHNVSHDIIDVEFDIEWRHGAVEGTVDAPELVYIRWMKIDGSTYVKLLEGSAILTPVGNAVTEVQLIEHLDTIGTGPEDVESFFTDMYDEILAWKDGEDLPEYDGR